MLLVTAACSADNDPDSRTPAGRSATVAPETAPRGAGGTDTSTSTEAADSTDGPETTDDPAQEVTQIPAIEVSPLREAGIEDWEQQRFEIPAADWLADAHGSVWVKRNDGALERIDPATNSITASIEVHEDGADCAGIGAGSDQLWVCTGPDSIGRVDPWSNTIDLTVEIDKVMEQGTIPIAYEHIWVLTDEGNTLTGIGVWTGTADLAFDLPTTCAEVAAGHDALWAACPGAGAVLKIDPADGSELARADDLPGTRNLAVGDAVYAGFTGGTARLDPDSGAATGAVNVGPGTSAGELETHLGVVWVRAEGTFLRSFDGRSLVFADQISAPETSGGDVLHAHGSLWASAYSDGVVYRLHPSAFN